MSRIPTAWNQAAKDGELRRLETAGILLTPIGQAAHLQRMESSMTTKTTLLNLLSRHQGCENGISAKALATDLGVPPRQLRRLISRCRDEDGLAICGHPNTGYFMATTANDLAASCEFLEHRALHSLRLLSRMKKVSLPELLGQLKLNQA